MSKHEDRRQRPARAGDGTLPAKRDRPDINWFGSSQRPVEEFADDHHPGMGGLPPANPGIGGSGAARARDAWEDNAPLAPAEVFPKGGPEAQSDG